jgi:hypothetical protein
MPSHCIHTLPTVALVTPHAKALFQIHSVNRPIAVRGVELVFASQFLPWKVRLNAVMLGLKTKAFPQALSQAGGSTMIGVCDGCCVGSLMIDRNSKLNR